MCEGERVCVCEIWRKCNLQEVLGRGSAMDKGSEMGVCLTRPGNSVAGVE